MYDAIVVGARCAGSPTAMLLAQKGHKVLLLDKAQFPSDTISTHAIWPPGTAKLKRWGLLDNLAATNCPLIKKATFDAGPVALIAGFLASDGVTDVYAPRRTVLDKILVDAAVDAGAELREGCAVEEIIFEDGRVVGVRCCSHGGSPVIEKARIVIGADGRNSIVARSTGAPEYNAKPPFCGWYYSYWSGVPVDGVEFYSRPGYAIGYIPTNDGLVCVPVISKYEVLEHYRHDIEAYQQDRLATIPELFERLRSGKREEKYFGPGDLPNFFRKPYGPGWALVGDAGYHKDPILAQGISDAFRDAEFLAEAVDKGLSGAADMQTALAEYEQKRNDVVMPMYEYNCATATLEPPPPEVQQLLGAIKGNQPETDRFFGVISGTVPVREFFAPENVQRIVAAARSH